MGLDLGSDLHFVIEVKDDKFDELAQIGERSHRDLDDIREFSTIRIGFSKESGGKADSVQ